MTSVGGSSNNYQVIGDGKTQYQVSSPFSSNNPQTERSRPQLGARAANLSGIRSVESLNHLLPTDPSSLHPSSIIAGSLSSSSSLSNNKNEAKNILNQQITANNMLPDSLDLMMMSPPGGNHCLQTQQYLQSSPTKSNNNRPNNTRSSCVEPLPMISQVHHMNHQQPGIRQPVSSSVIINSSGQNKDGPGPAYKATISTSVFPQPNLGSAPLHKLLKKSETQVSLVKPVVHDKVQITAPANKDPSGFHNTNRVSDNNNRHDGDYSHVNSAVQSSHHHIKSVSASTKQQSAVKPSVPSQRVLPQHSASVSNLHHLLNQNNNNSCQVPFHNFASKSAAVVFPEPQQNGSNKNFQNLNLSDLKQQSTACSPSLNSPDSDRFELIPETREHPAGLDIDEFLPKHLQDTVRLGYSLQPEMSEADAMSQMFRGHKSLVTALSHRKKNIQIILAVWSKKDPMKALDQAIQLGDESVMVDILNILNLKPWVLDSFVTWLTVILAT